jgi:Kelch motif
MTDQRELDRLLGAFFVEGTNEVADRVIDAALIEIDQTQQRRVGRLPRRFLTMKTPTRVAVAAVVGVIAVGGALYAVNPWQSAIAPSATPDSSAGPSATPSLSAVPAGTPSWTVTGKMVFPRSKSSTLLPDGTVLVAGGGTTGRENSAELFDPVSGTWSETRRMGQYMDDPISVLLHDGTVLVGTTQLYDPPTKTWTTVAGGMPRGPDGGFLGDLEAMFVLPDGKVLALGRPGRTALYDPSRRSWTPGATMVTPQFGFAAVLLADGRVLVVGGSISDEQPVASAELYDPVSGSWTVTGSMIEARDALTATLLPDGRVLVVGAFTTSRRDVVPARGELYDPASGTWTATANLVTPRIRHSATRLTDGTVLIAGGADGVDTLPSVELFDPSVGTWTATADMVTPRSQHRATLLADGRVLVFGGNTDDGHGAGAEIYDPGDR